jgi:hypothetical protein
MKAPNIHFGVKLGQSANPGDFFVDPLPGADHSAQLGPFHQVSLPQTQDS